MPHVTPLRPGNPRRVGRYRLTGRIDDLVAADEDQAEVFLARSVSGDMVVVTLLSEDRASDAAARDRFTAEARAARRVPPFCAARILDAGFEASHPYLISEFVPGPSLAEVIGHVGPLPQDTVRALAIGCATGLAAIHQAGQVHGHMRPELVVLSPQGPRVVQFSITPPYGNATPAADMFAWAQTVLASAGKPPVWPPNLADLDSLPEDLRVVVSDCLAPDPADRLTARGVLAELLGNGDVAAGMLAEGSRVARAAARVPVPPEQPVPVTPPRRIGSRTLVWAGAAAFCLVALVGATIAMFTGNSNQASNTASVGHGAHGGHPRPTPLPDRVTALFAGDWTGTIHQTTPALTPTVDLTLTQGAASGTVAYPALKCSGHVKVVSVTAASITLRQSITVGQKVCENGLITLSSQTHGMVRFSFSQGGGTAPTGTLTHG